MNSGLIKNQNVNSKKITLSRDLRRSMTEAEKIFRANIRNRKFRGLKFRRQQVIDGFIVDFYCESLRLCIEIDGEVHDTEEAKKYDKNRDRALELRGLRMLRFQNNEVINDIEGVLRRLQEVN